MARKRQTKHRNIFDPGQRQSPPGAVADDTMNVANESNRFRSDEDATTTAIIRYDTLEMNEEGMIVIPRDVFRPKPKSWTEDHIAACLPYRPAFDKRCWDANQKPILDHSLTQNTAANRKSWGDFLRDKLFGGAFNSACKDGWNRGMKALMDAPKEKGDTGPGYEWRGHRPTTRNDILELLRSEEMVDLATKGEIVELMGCVFKWGHGLTLQVGSSKWAKDGVNRWISAMDYKCVMGNEVAGEANCSTHGFVRCFKITATNSLQTQIRRIEREKYKHQLIVQESRGNIGSDNFKTVDLGGELPKNMKDAMTRKEGCVFKVRVVGERKKEGTGGLALKIMSIVRESHQNKVERKDLEGIVRKEIIRVYEKAEGEESSEEEEEESNEGEEGRADSL